MANPPQLFLLADHIKLSLLERQRAISLNLEPSAQDGSISRSLESLREGIEATEAEAARLETKGDPFVLSAFYKPILTDKPSVLFLVSKSRLPACVPSTTI
jgi:hypothetical protein